MSNQDRVLTKCAWRLIPFVGLLYVVSFVDRTNAGLAALTMNKDLGFSPTVFGFGAGVFFVGYSLFQVPANVLPLPLAARWRCVRPPYSGRSRASLRRTGRP
jgi:ACS family tartrate transporter-like MFS transporter